MENRRERHEQTRTKKPNKALLFRARVSAKLHREEETKEEQVRKVLRKTGIKVILSCKYSEFLFCLNFIFFKYMIHI